MNHKFKELHIWQESMELAKHIYNLVEILPDKEKYGLTSQLTRCAVSVPSNIAEGCSRNSIKEQIRFLEIAIGSCYEMETQLLLVESIFPNVESSKILEMNRKVQSKIGGFKSFLKKQ